MSSHFEEMMKRTDMEAVCYFIQNGEYEPEPVKDLDKKEDECLHELWEKLSEAMPDRDQQFIDSITKIAFDITDVYFMAGVKAGAMLQRNLLE